jgi:FSR family fosmidomycin resistance protein-like MFS transporter
VRAEWAEKAGKTSEISAENTVLSVLLAISFSHLLNDIIQSLIPSIYPLVKENFHLSFAQIGLITLTFQLTASILQPVVGFYTDRRSHPYSLAAGMCCTLVGLILLSLANRYAFVLMSVALIGVGSSVFHPEASRVAYMAAGRRRGFAQSLFQLGGNLGSSLGPLLAALVIAPSGEQSRVAWFSIVAFGGIITLTKVGGWYQRNLFRLHRRGQGKGGHAADALTRRQVTISLAVLIALMFSKFFYLASMSSYYTFYLISKFHLSIRHAQMYLFVFLFAVAAGTLVGGPVGDRIGRKYVIWVSILGAAPFTLLLPHVSLYWTAALSVVVGFVLASAFSAILVYAQELLPGKVGMIAGLFFGLAFGMGGMGSAVLGWLADATSIKVVFLVCSFLPLIGVLTVFLPNLEKKS